MQKNKIKQYIAAFIGLAGLSTVFSSCLKETSNPPLYGYSTTNLVSFQDNGGASAGGAGYGTTTTPFPLFNFSFKLVNDTAGFNAIVIYGPGGPAPQDITVNVAPSQAVLDSFNSANSTAYTMPDPSTYTVPASVVIPKGQTQAYLHITIKANSAFDVTANNAIALQITSSSYGAVSANFGSEINAFAVQNQYDGNYSFKGYTLRAGDGTKTGNFSGQTMALVTSGASSVTFGSLQIWADLSGVGIGNPVLTVNSDNSVTVTSSGGASNAPGYNSHYDPSSKTFFVSFTWGGGPSSRLATDTLTYTGSR